MIKIAVVDGMGGGIGSQLISQLKHELKDKAEIIALGTNSTATASMLRSGADKGATGENAIRVNTSRVDIVLGPLGIVLPDSLMGEITATIACSILSSPCRKILLPINQNHVEIVGLESRPVSQIIKDAVIRLKEITC
jgi:hypothetical protein